MSEASPTPEIPDDLQSLMDDLRFREQQRRAAIDGAWAQVETAKDESSQRYALNNLVRMMGVLDEYHGLYPEVFPPTGSDDTPNEHNPDQ